VQVARQVLGRCLARLIEHDERLGERACAFVVGDLDFEAMLEYLDSHRVSKTYWPERLELVDTLPRTPSGKIQKFILRAQARELVTI
jgi:3-phosphoshikimate 1-carboxyvinyltransferase